MDSEVVRMGKLSDNRGSTYVNNFLCSIMVKMMYYYIFLCVQTSAFVCSF